LEVSEINEKCPAPQATMRSILYRFETEKGWKSDTLPGSEKLHDFLDSETFPLKLESKGRKRVIDLRKMVIGIQVLSTATEIEMVCDANGVTPRPQLVYEAIFGPMPQHSKITKVKVAMDGEVMEEIRSAESQIRPEDVESLKRNIELGMKNVE
jgi:hypothetical protein